MKKIVYALVVILALFISACASDTPAPQDEQPQEEAPQETLQTPPAETIPEQPTEEEQMEQPATEQDAQETSAFRELISMQGNLEFSATYNVVTTAQGTTTNAVMTQYFKGLDRIRMDMTTQGTEARTYILGDTIHVCTQLNGNWMCFENEQSNVSAAGISDEVRENPEQFSPMMLPARTIAGTTASCYRLSMPESTTDYCFTADGVLLYSKTEDMAGQYMSEVTATSFSTSVADAVFEVPQSAGTGGGFDPSMYGY